MSKVGRNDPCPCGSGKKYKNCHMAEDEEKKHIQKEEEERLNSEKANVYSLFYYKSNIPNDEDHANKDPLDVEDYENDVFTDEDNEDTDFFDELENENTDEEDEEELSPEEEKAIDEFWEKFQDAEFTEKTSLMEESFNHPVFTYPDFIFDLFFEMSSAAKTSSDREIFTKMVRHYKEILPEDYEYDAASILDYCVDFTVIDNKPDELKSFFLEYADHADDKLYLFITSAQEIAYHGYLDLLVEGFRRGWANVKNSDDIFPWAFEDFSFQGFKYEIYNYLQNAQQTNTGIDLTNFSADKRILLDRLRYFDNETDENILRKYLNSLTGTNAPNWDKNLLEQNYNRLKYNEKITYLTNLTYLFNEFIYYLHDEIGKSYPKADLMRSGISVYLQNRLSGEFKNHLPKKDKLYKNFISKTLLPDFSTLEEYIFDLAALLGFNLYKSLALYECIPYWLDFLQLNNLIDQDAKDKVFNSMAELNSVIQEIIKSKTPYDEFLKAEMKAAWKNK